MQSETNTTTATMAPTTSVNHDDDDAVGLDTVGQVTSTREKEKMDAELEAFQKMLEQKSKKKKEKKEKKVNKKEEKQLSESTDATNTNEQKKDDGTNNETDTNDNTTTKTSDNVDADDNNAITDNNGEIKDDIFNSEDCRDYPYTELLTRIYRHLHEKNPNLVEQKSHKLPPPLTHLIGSKKTGWANFDQICKLLVRKPDHVKQFFLAEMNTTGNLDGEGNLVLKGRWRPKQFESLLKKYIREYIECQNCHSPETTLTKDNATRLFFLTCKICNSTRSVAQIKAGFHAVSRDDRRLAKKNAQ